MQVANLAAEAAIRTGKSEKRRAELMDDVCNIIGERTFGLGIVCEARFQKFPDVYKRQ